MTIYLDSSTVLRVFLRQQPYVPGWGEWDRAFSSQLLLVEVARAFDRLRVEGKVSPSELSIREIGFQRFLSDIQVLELGGAVLRRATMRFTSVVGSLDAIHIASALIVEEQMGERPAFATHDRQQAIAAAALGFQIIGV